MKSLKLFLGTLLFCFPSLALANQTCPELTKLQIWAGYVSWIDFVKTVGVASFAMGLILFFKGFLMKFWDMIWQRIRDISDIIAYILSIGCIASGYWVPIQYQLWPVFGGCILFGASLLFTIWLRKLKSDNPVSFYGILFIAWSLVAAFYGMPEVGFLAIAALMGLFGYSIIISPFCYAFGFRENKKSFVSRATAAALYLVAFSIIQHSFMPDIIDHVKVFMPGINWLGSLVGFTGLLILSNKWYVMDEELAYGWLQVVTIAAYSLCMTYGMIADVNSLAGMGGVFLFVFYIPAKFIEIEMEGLMGFGLKLMMVGGFLSGIWFYASKNEVLIRQYLPMVFPG